MQFKMGEKFYIKEMPQLQTIICHGIDFSGNEEGCGVVAMEALMQQLETQQVGGSSHGRSGVFALPGDKVK
jgi:hypothetical protein